MFDHFTAFIDEHGNENLNLDSPGASKFFIITAVVVEDAGIELLETSIDSVRKVQFQTGEMKSSSVANNHARRTRVMELLCSTQLSYLSLIVNKAEIDNTSGLGYKKSFRKFLPNLVYNRLYKTFPNLTVISDNHGGKKFMDSVKAYVDKNKKESLFEKQNFEFHESKERVLIQAADFIAGTWGKTLDNSIDPAIREVWKTQLKKSAIFVDHWPPSPESIFPKTEIGSYLNNLVRQQCYQLVQQYISTNQMTGSLNEEEAAEMEIRLAVLRFLLYENDVIESGQFIYAKRIIAFLKKMNYGEITPRKLASLVISPLRDSGVIISSGNKGYRIPTNVDDLIEFARTTGEKVVPMVARLGRARDQIYLASNKQLNIIDEAGWPIMNNFVDSLGEYPGNSPAGDVETGEGR